MYLLNYSAKLRTRKLWETTYQKRLTSKASTKFVREENKEQESVRVFEPNDYMPKMTEFFFEETDNN